jgi:spore germination protein YaaH
LLNPAAGKALISNLTVLAQQHGYAGYVFDFENISHAALTRYPALIAQARAALKPLGREVWVAAPFGDDAWPLAQLGAVSDSVVLMAYDQHWAAGEPGPPAGQEWFEQTMARDMRLLDPRRTVVSLGAYGYDWTLSDKSGPQTAESVEF